MINRIFKILIVIFLSIGIASISLAQRQTGSIAGKVTDNEGIPLPGVSVTLSGPNLMGILTYTTAESGDFRFPSVPPGSNYTLVVELSGFQKIVREGLIVNVGKTVRLVIESKPATIEEEIIVIAPSPTLDMTSTKSSVTYSSDLIANIPLARNYSSIIDSAPGVVEAQASHGSGIRTNQVCVDGVNITSRAIGYNSLQFSFDIYEEVELETGAHPAEVGVAPGAYVNIVTKSGGNEFHGSALAYYFNEGMAKSLIPESEAEAVGLTKPTGIKSHYDFSGTLGGPIIRDKLWFFVNGRFVKTENEYETIVNGLYDSTQDEIYTFTKLTSQLRPNIKLTGMVSFRNSNRPFGRVSYYSDKYTSFYQENGKNWVAQGMINWILNQNTFFDIRYGYHKSHGPNHLNPDVDPKTPRLYDRDTRIRTGQPNYMYDMDGYAHQITFSLNHFLDNFLGGNHEIKAGVEYDFGAQPVPFWSANAITEQYTYKGLPWGYHDATPYKGYFTAATVGATKEDWDPIGPEIRRFGAYFQDSFTFKNRITLNFGIRYDESHADYKGGSYKPVGAESPVLRMLAPNIFRDFTTSDQKNMVVWKDFSPRLGVVFDVFGDQTTSLKASWSRYSDRLLMQWVIKLSPAHPQFFRAYWFDLNKNGIMETTDDYSVLSSPVDMFDFDLYDYLDPDFTSPYTEEIIVGLGRELFKDFSVNVSYIYKNKKRMVENVEKYRGSTADSEWWSPYTVTEPGWDGIFGTSDDNQITIYGLKKGAPPSRILQSNPSQVKRKYQALEFVLNKRMSQGWQLLCSVVLSKLEGNRDSTHRGSAGDGSAFDTPNWLVNRYGRLLYDRPVVIKLQGSVILPYGFILSGYYAHSSGAPWGRTIQIQLPDDPLTYEYPGAFLETVMAEAPGTRRYPSRNNLDLRIEKIFSIGNLGKLGIFLDVINAFGERGYEISQDPGGRVYNNGTFQEWTSFGGFTSVYGLRTYKVSARFTF